MELKKQIVASGNVLVKEYIDDGYSGARLDRPAMDQLRKDLKTNLFDTIYFLNTDRIAREVTYQTIIIAEILKYKKQVIINGKDYIHNPENKFTLTVLGAVAELERAKIIERVTRAKQLKIRQGHLLGCGSNIYGYDYHRRTPNSEPEYTINKNEAKIVKQVFETYANTQIGLRRIAINLEEKNVPTKSGKNIWRVSLLKNIISNEMYIGVRYYNMVRRIREYANPIYDIKHSSSKIVKRERKDWIGVKVPAIIKKELFEKAKERREWNKKHYRNPKIIQLLSSVIRCGCCGSSVFAYRRYYTDKRLIVPKIFHRVSYKCNAKHHKFAHSPRAKFRNCDNKEIKAETLESQVFKMIEETLINPSKLQDHMDFFKRRTQANQIRIEKQLKDIEVKNEKLTEAKTRIIDLYANDEIEKGAYITKNLEYDNELNRLKIEKKELINKIPLLHKKEIIDMSIKQYCNNAKLRFQKAKDFETKRQFVLDYIEKIVYLKGKVELHGHIPVKLKMYDDKNQNTELAKIEFCIRDQISKQMKKWL